ncbi:MAG: methyltransferase domain-containing protein [Anaerolineae bacterium]|nr:methyltransferase domain-containing protein [Anaerolineae bacterium]
MIFANPCPSEAALQAAYALPKEIYDQFFQTAYLNTESILSGNAIWQRNTSQQYLDLIEQQLGHTGRILDLGCGPGVFLEMAQSRGWETAGVDPGDWRQGYDKDELLNIHRCSLFEAGLTEASFDAVFMGSVLEHLHNPRRYLDVLYRLLKPGGVIYVVGLPNIKSWTIQLGLDRWIGNHPPLHLLYFSRQTARLLFTNMGYRQISIKCYGMSETMLEAVFNRCGQAYTGDYAGYVTESTWRGQLLRSIRRLVYEFFNFSGIGSVLEILARKP